MFLFRVRDKLVQDWQSSKLRYEAERENCARLQLLLDTHKETSQSLQVRTWISGVFDTSVECYFLLYYFHHFEIYI